MIVDIDEILLFNVSSVPALKTVVTNTYHWPNQGKMANEFS